MFLRNLEDKFDETVDRILGTDLSKLHDELDEFKEHIDRNRISAWLPVVFLLVQLGLVLTVKYAILEARDANVELWSVMLPSANAVGHTIPLMLFSASFALIWRSVFHKYASRFHSVSLERENIRIHAVLATFFAWFSFVLAFLAEPTLHSEMIALYYLSLLAAFGFALTFSVKIYQLVRNVARSASREVSGARAKQSTAVAAHQEFPALAHMTLGWCGTNLLTTAIFLIFFAILVVHYFLWGGFHNFFEYKMGKLESTDVGNYGRIAILESIMLTSFLMMGFFSGTFRRKATSEQFKIELRKLNNVLSENIPPKNPLDAQETLHDDNVESTTNDQVQKQKLLREVSALLESARGLSCLLLAGFALVLGATWGVAATFFLFLFGSFLFNDLMDFWSGKDHVCHPNRPLPSSRLTASFSSIVTTVSFVSCLAISAAIGPDFLALTGCCLLVSAVYSSFLKRHHPVIATPLWCAATVAMFLYFLDASLIAYGLSFAAVLGRELLLEERDSASDEAFAKSYTYSGLLGQYLVPVAVGLILLAQTVLLFSAPVLWQSFVIAVTMLLIIYTFFSSDRPSLRIRSKTVYTLAIALPG